MKAFITGIAGFAGSHLAEGLLRDGTEVSGLALASQEITNLSGFEDGIRLTLGDVRDREALAALFKEIRPDAIYHLAAIASVPEARRSPEETFSVNINGTACLLGAVQDSGISGEVFIVTSSEIYGSQPGPVAETAPLRPANLYSVSKAGADLLAFQHFFEFGLPVVRFRPFNHTGPRQAPNYVCSDFARQIARIEAGMAEPVISVGNLDVVRDFLSVEDVTAAYRLARGRLKPGEAYNVASGEGRRIGDLLDLLLGMTDSSIEVRPRLQRRRTGDVESLVGDASRLREATGWAPAHPLEGAMAALLQEWRVRIREGPQGP